MRKLRLIYRLTSFIVYLLLLIVTNSLIKLFTKDKKKRQQRLSSGTAFLCKSAMKRLNIRIQVSGLEFVNPEENYLFVANHMGYLDIPILYAYILNSRFLSHTQNGTFLAFIARSGGSYFIKRDFTNIRQELRETADILKEGVNLVVFPEGTSTDGSSLLPFRPLMFGTAVRAQKPVLPVCIKYTKINGVDFGPQNRDLVCWYLPESSFIKHLFSLLQTKSVEVSIELLPPICSKDKSSRELAELSHKKIREARYGNPT